MNTKEILQGLIYTRAKHIKVKNPISFGETNIIAMLDDVIPAMEKLIKLETLQNKVVPLITTINGGQHYLNVSCGWCNSTLENIYNPPENWYENIFAFITSSVETDKVKYCPCCGVEIGWEGEQ